MHTRFFDEVITTVPLDRKDSHSPLTFAIYVHGFPAPSFPQ